MLAVGIARYAVELVVERSCLASVVALVDLLPAEHPLLLSIDTRANAATTCAPPRENRIVLAEETQQTLGCATL